MREPDLWWQLRTGEWILEHEQIPHQDVFSYTYEGAKWVNIKWGSEVLFALIEKASGPECIFLLQALVTCLILFVLTRAWKFSNCGSQLTLAISLLLTLVAMEYRIIGRPEMFSHLFTVVFLFFLLGHRRERSNIVFWLIPLQIVWANLHEAFGIGIVLTSIFAVAAWLEYFLSKRGWSFSSELPKKISLLLLLQIAAVVVNPNGFQLLTKPLNILGQVYQNKYTTELFDFRQPEYWRWNVYWVIGILIIGAIGNWVYLNSVKAKKNRLQFFVEQYGIGYLLVLLAFFYLAATAYRNIVFLELVFFPMLVSGVDALLSKISVREKFSRQMDVGFCLLLLGFYCAIVSNKYYELSNSRDRFGMEVLSTYNPVGAADFVKQNRLNGKCFSDYLTSSYLLWRLQPEFKTFIDLRDLDVFPAQFFNTFAETVTFPDEFEKQDSVYHFNYVVLYRPQFTVLHKYLYSQSRYRLGYMDAVAAVYVDSSRQIAEITGKPMTERAHAVLANLNKLLNPFFEFGKSDAGANFDYLYASYYTSAGDLEKAEKFARASLKYGNAQFEGYQALGEVYYQRALGMADLKERQNLLVQAGATYQQSLNEKSDFAPANLGLGAVYFQQKSYQRALESFEKAIANDKGNITAYNFAAECCKALVNQKVDEVGNVKRAIGFYRGSNKLNPDNPFILMNLGFLYFRINDCDNSKKYLGKVVGFQGLSEQQRRNAEECLKKCGL